MTPVTIIPGTGPVILGQPHSGTFVPDDIFARLNSLGQELRDTDWHVPQLYDGLLPSASIVRANFSRYVIDANRDPEGTSLYPGLNVTELVPTSTFDGELIWHANPAKSDIAQRIGSFHRVYHAALEAEIARVKAKHGFAVLYDCHSIRSEIPYLFDNQLPDLNIGDNSGRSCAPAITSAVAAICAQSPVYSHVVNGRFKGGWTTRHYGRPETGVHAIQMELVQRCYLESETPPFAYSASHAAPLRDLLGTILKAVEDTASSSLKTET
ncbi:MAG: N-formylglutamate amidohydrolase [Hyphomonas sp. BRH_c22]|uniref:N-formylglutamate deformylase n=1 Tax=Hyphomonas sp. BRH_c22 TaxID=1629710 RepID=UPI0005F1D847|nr:N-formylglutamate deformylase [Hyphomonas sp. BRH_c22]KJS39170.1 MAG: N-formylglutamate amidohydrolase [Hyphomonas sp. BRH_c22]